MNSDVHRVPLAEGTQSIQTTVLIIVLQVLEEAGVTNVSQKLTPEFLVTWSVRPVKNKSGSFENVEKLMFDLYQTTITPVTIEVKK